VQAVHRTKTLGRRRSHHLTTRTPAALTQGTNQARRGSRKRPGPRECELAGRGPPQRIPLSPERHGRDDHPKQKCGLLMEVALTVAAFYLVYMLQRTLPAGFIALCLPTKADTLPQPWPQAWQHEIVRVRCSSDDGSPVANLEANEAHRQTGARA
jgi:hypothetical protein